MVTEEPATSRKETNEISNKEQEKPLQKEESII